MKSFSRSAVIIVVILLLISIALPAQIHAKGETERVLIRFKPGQKASVMRALQRQDAQIHHEFDELNVVAVTLPASSIDRIQSKAAIMAVEPDLPRYALDQTVPYGVESVEARNVWDADNDGEIDPGAPTGEGRMVCIIDSGVNINHEDFSGVNFVGGYPASWYIDTCGHGSHVAGTVAAMNNTTGVVGVTPGTVSLYILKVFGNNCDWTYSSTLIDAAYRCRDAGADIINMSLGGELAYSGIENYVFQSLYDTDGILSVASAGNGGGTTYYYPASYDSVISVGAVDENNVVAGFSRRNDKVELTAPGVDVLSIYMNGGYIPMSGTSMAAPHVSAAAAVVWSADTSKTNAEIRTLLQDTALDLGAPGRDVDYGYGIVQSLSALNDLYPPTAVELVRFETQSDGEAIRVQWETAAEIDNLGFHLYRAEAPDGTWTRLNDRLIPSQVPPGSPVGASYELVDEDVELGITYYYRLEDVDLRGNTTSHGPVTGTLLPRKLLPKEYSP